MQRSRDTGFFLVQQLFASSGFEAQKIKAAIYAMNSSLVRTGYGQFLDVTLTSLAQRDIDNVHVYKTGYYTFVSPLTIGVILAGATTKRLTAIEKYGLYVAYAFQHRDDILGVFGDPTVTGKSNTSDVLTGKKTMLYFKTLEKATNKDLAIFKKYYGQTKLSNAQLENIRTIIKDTGALAATQDYVIDNAKKAVNMVSQITPEAKYQKLLSELAMFVATRDK